MNLSVVYADYQRVVKNYVPNATDPFGRKKQLYAEIILELIQMKSDFISVNCTKI